MLAVIASPGRGDGAGPIARDDGDHEGHEEAFDRPAAEMLVDRLAVDRGATADQQLAEMPGAVARLDQPPVEPDHIGDGQSEQRRRGQAQHLHREEVDAVPIPAADAIEEADRRPGRPQAGDLDQAEVERLPRAAAAVRPSRFRWSGLRWTLSTRSDQSTIGTPQASRAIRAPLSPARPKLRAVATQANSPARPARPTPVLTAERGRGSCRASACDLHLGVHRSPGLSGNGKQAVNASSSHPSSRRRPGPRNTDIGRHSQPSVVLGPGFRRDDLYLHSGPNPPPPVTGS